MKCFVLLIIAICISCQIQPHHSLRSSLIKRHFMDDDCVLPSISKGRARWARRPLAKFVCASGYRLAGSKYITCRDGDWEEPPPVCVRPGCEEPVIQHVFTIPMHQRAWLEFFCLPGYQLLGSPVIYCDGVRWNGTAPRCVQNNSVEILSCNFDMDLCGWQQDIQHDFDWTRINRETPSSMHHTGPPHDHTTGSGYYMYIESSGQAENNSARLISPIYEADLSNDGCFSFFYHMFGRYIGGLRVYQKPLSVNLEDLRANDQFLLFEKWYNQGENWIGDKSKLMKSDENFQIVIEGIRGAKYTSDIAIDDVAILQGENCTVPEPPTTTPQPLETCQDRCFQPTDPSSADCSCTWDCFSEGTCCQDVYFVCFDKPTTTASPRSDYTTTENATVATTTKGPSTTTQRPSTTQRVSTTMRTTITTPWTTSRRPIVFKSTTAVMNATGILKRNNGTSTTTRQQNVTATTIRTTTNSTKPTPPSGRGDNVTTTRKSKDFFKPKPRIVVEQKPSSSGKATAITLVVLLCCIGCACAVLGARTARGRAVVDRLRGRATSCSEVRYLTGDTDD